MVSFWESNVNFYFFYPEAIKELNIDPIDRPDLDIEEISKDNGLVMVVNVPAFLPTNWSSNPGMKVFEPITKL